METKEVVGSVIYSVNPRGSIKTSKPSTVEIAVGHRFANRADDLNQDIKEGNPPETGLVALHLIAVYEDGKEEVIDLALSDVEVKVNGVSQAGTEETTEELTTELDESDQHVEEDTDGRK